MNIINISIKRIIFGTLFIHNITALTTHRKTFGFGNNFNNIFSFKSFESKAFHIVFPLKLFLQGYQQFLMYFICVWGAFKDPKSNFKPVDFALYFGNFTLLVLKVILASKLSDLEEFKNLAANNQIARKRMKMRLKSNRCYCRQALKQMFWVEWCWSDSKIEF